MQIALADWTYSNWHPAFGKLLLHLQIDTLCGQHDYSWVPLVPETIGPIDQFNLNVFSMASALVFGLFSKKTPLHLVFGLNKLTSINLWVEFYFYYLPVPGWWNDVIMLWQIVLKWVLQKSCSFSVIAEPVAV